MAQIYEVSARSSIELNNLQDALNEGQFSLRLLPENSVLIVLMANVAVQQLAFTSAESMARDGLQYLNEFAAPADFTKAQWDITSSALKGSAYSVLGRIYAAKALRNAQPDKDLLKTAINFLDQSIAWNQSDPEPFYLPALLEIKSAEMDLAARDLGYVARTDHALKAQALAQLRVLCKDTSFDRCLSQIPDPVLNPPISRDSNRERSASIREGYVGSAKCRVCHPYEFETRRETGMARMLRAYKPENIFGDFNSRAEYKDGSGDAVVRGGLEPRTFSTLRIPKLIWQRFFVDYTNRFQVAAGIRNQNTDGSFHVLPIQYNTIKKSWINYC